MRRSRLCTCTCLQWLLCLVVLSMRPAEATVTFTAQPSDITTKEGQPFHLNCNISLETEVNYSLSYSWQKDNLDVATEQIFHVTSATSNHSGVYVCVVEEKDKGVHNMYRSRPATVIIISSGRSDSTYAVLVTIVSLSVLAVLLFILLCGSGLYIFFCKTQRSNKLYQRWLFPWQQRDQSLLSEEAELSSTRAGRRRQRSHSLGQLFHLRRDRSFPQNPALSKSIENLLSISQPTQATDLQDADTLDFDLRLDEALFESPDTDVPGTPLGRTLVPRVLKAGGSIKSILKERPSSDAALRRASVVSDMSLDLPASDDASLSMSKSVRFLVSTSGSGDELAADSGILTGTSSPHTSLLERRASEPEVKGYFPLNERRKSAPGDLVGEYEGEKEEEGDEKEDEEERESEEWDKDVKNESAGDRHCTILGEDMSVRTSGGSRMKLVFREEEGKGGRKMEGRGGEKEKEERKEREMQELVMGKGKGGRTMKRSPSDIASRMAQLLSAAGGYDNLETELKIGNSVSPERVSKLKVSEMRQRFQQHREGDEILMFLEEKRERGAVSELVREKAELFRVQTVSGENKYHCRGRGEEGEEAEEENASSKETVAQDIEEEEEGGGEGEVGRQEEGVEDTSLQCQSSPAINIPVFVAPFMSSPWQPSCLRGQTISPFDFPDDDKFDWSEVEGEGEEELLLPVQMAGSAAVSPIGRSWLCTSNSKVQSNPAAPTLIKTQIAGANEKSPYFFESVGRGRGQLPVSVQRLSAIPEETASTMGSITDVAMETN